MLEGLGLGDGLHPLAELVLVVEQVGDARLGVLELGAPESASNGHTSTQIPQYMHSA